MSTVEGVCLDTFSERLLWVSDMTLWAVYLGIAVFLVVIGMEEDNKKLRSALYLFAAFISTCGLTHVARGLEWEQFLVWINPICAVVSAATLAYLLLHFKYFCSVSDHVEDLEHRRQEMEKSIGVLLHMPRTPGGRSDVNTG